MTFAGLFALDLGGCGRRAWHVRIAGASFLIYALALAGLELAGGNMWVKSLLLGLVGLNTALIVLSVDAFDRVRRLHWALPAMPLASSLSYLVPLLLPHERLPVAPVAAAELANTAALAATTLGAICLLARNPSTEAPRSWRIVLVALLGYMPGYLLSFALGLGLADPLPVLLAFPLVSDQVLLPLLGLGLLGLSAERDAAMLSETARRDPLTGAANRAALAGLTGVAPEAGVVLLDVDRFKLINDGHGHAAGDAVLVALADGARQMLPAGGELVRLGGDEFLAICPSLATAQRLAEQALLLGREAQPAWTVSIGIAARRPGEADLAPAIARADGLLYHAKTNGRARLAA